MRGKGQAATEELFAERITPAYAGKRRELTEKQKGKKDHPCVCGEKLGNPLPIHELPGSPLRMRGKVVRDDRGLYLRGITPAYAGKRQPE